MKPIKEIEFYCKANTTTKGGEIVYEAFPVDSSRKDKDTPINWATVRKRNMETYKIEIVSEPVIFKYNNKFDNVRIVEIDRRSNGGRVYKSIITTEDNNKFYVDLREEALLDTILNVGIKPNGYLNGEFAFVKESSQTNLVRCGSERYKEAVKAQEAIENKGAIISTKDLKPMTLYQVGVGNKKYVLYVGECLLPVIDIIRDGEGDNWRGNCYPIEKVELLKTKKQRLFLDIYELENETDIDEIKEKVRGYNLSVKPSIKPHREVMRIDNLKLKEYIFNTYFNERLSRLIITCSPYPYRYNGWGWHEVFYVPTKDYKAELERLCVGRTKEEVTERFEEYKDYHIEKGRKK